MVLGGEQCVCNRGTATEYGMPLINSCTAIEYQCRWVSLSNKYTYIRRNHS